MTRDRKRRESADRETERSGDREFASERREATAEAEPTRVERSLAVGGVENLARKRRPAAVSERVIPTGEGRRQDAVRVGITDPLDTTRSDERVARRVAPEEDVRAGGPTAATVAGLSGERTGGAVADGLEFDEHATRSASVVLADRPGVDRVVLPVTERFTPLADRTSRSEEPLGGTVPAEGHLPDADPVFDWGGGSPYTSRRPTMVIHRDEGDAPSLSFLQALLRDTYKEMVGGEPTAEHVEFVANEPAFPEVGRSIVTLDLSTGGWDREVRNGRPVIEREGVDVVPELRSVAATLYTGELGYVVVNVPGEWEDPLRHADFFDRLVAAVAGDDAPGSGGPDASEADGPLVDRVGSPPVVLAEPRRTDPDEFFETVSRYYGFAPGRDDGRGFLDDARPGGVERLEALQERVLRQDDWRRVAATRARRSDEESDEHYLWKAAVVDGLVQRLYRQVGGEYDALREFHRAEVLDPRGTVTIETEWSPLGVENGPTADVYVGETPHWATVRAFLGGLESLPGRDVVVEFETGIGGGAHNFRSLRETLSGYELADDSVGYVAVAVPPRVLFRGRRRARMLAELVDSWNDVVPGIGAGLFVPRLAPGVTDAGTCWELLPVGSAVDGLYDAAGADADTAEGSPGETDDYGEESDEGVER